MSLGKEQIWIRYKRATRLQYIVTLLALHRLGFGAKRLAEFEKAFGDMLTVVNDCAADDVLIDKLGEEFKSMGFDIRSLLSDKTDLTFSQQSRSVQAEKKMQLTERMEVAKKLQAAGFYNGKSY